MATWHSHNTCIIDIKCVCWIVSSHYQGHRALLTGTNPRRKNIRYIYIYEKIMMLMDHLKVESKWLFCFQAETTHTHTHNPTTLVSDLLFTRFFCSYTWLFLVYYTCEDDKKVQVMIREISAGSYGLFIN